MSTPADIAARLTNLTRHLTGEAQPLRSYGVNTETNTAPKGPRP